MTRPRPERLRSEFRGKTWISWVLVLFCGSFAVFSLVEGLLSLTGAAKKIDGKPATDAGIALSIFGVGFSLLTALTLFRAIALGRPMLRVCREGIVVNLIGASSLDDLPPIPGFSRAIALVRLGWLIVTLQGFKQELIYSPWPNFRDVQVWGFPMQRKLTIFAPFFRAVSDGAPPECVGQQLTFEQVAFAASLDGIARSIMVYSADASARESLPSWGS